MLFDQSIGLQQKKKKKKNCQASAMGEKTIDLIAFWANKQMCNFRMKLFGVV